MPLDSVIMTLVERLLYEAILIVRHNKVLVIPEIYGQDLDDYH